MYTDAHYIFSLPQLSSTKKPRSNKWENLNRRSIQGMLIILVITLVDSHDSRESTIQYLAAIYMTQKL